MKILLIRHGQTSWNVEGRIQGQTDIELNENGIKQAKQVREKLLQYPIDIIMTSPLQRAKKTAEIIAEGRNIPFIIEEQLRERSFGKYEGKTREQMNFDDIWNYSLNLKYENFESVSELLERIEGFFEKLKKQYKDETILLVSHAGVAVAAEVYFKGLPNEKQSLCFIGIENCEVKEYEL